MAAIPKLWRILVRPGFKETDLNIFFILSLNFKILISLTSLKTLRILKSLGIRVSLISLFYPPRLKL